MNRIDGMGYGRKKRSMKAFYRWMKSYYLPALEKRVDQLPERVAALANKVNKKYASFFVL